MCSAFHVPVFIRMGDRYRPESVGVGGDPPKKPLKTSHQSISSDCDETEDEEVKMNCVGGVPEYISSDDSSDEDDDESVASDSSEERYVNKNKSQPPVLHTSRPTSFLCSCQCERWNSELCPSASCATFGGDSASSTCRAPFRHGRRGCRRRD